ncbi:CAP domain-containing protein [Siminovitchia sp. FSL H7-0308]|uniref:YkwD family protein n=1 Tax=Siminovitchia thermophila TaxID=1245522 RepID=A0ABS2R9Q8_9BACI|nr:CAP domain-containing protein [Siminovitchia thermophila]MBM7716380.1 putative YkwD family protein [Siminovitchia thermophila]ONK21987.1 sporulation protein [Bacillus sp. VT-16-64]
MKKLVVSAAAAVALMASPLAGGTADAAQPNSGQQNGKVYYFYQTGDFSKMNDWCKQPYHKFTPKKKTWKQAPKQKQPAKKEQAQTPAPAPAKPAPAPAPEKQPGKQEEQQPTEQNGSQLSAFEQKVVDLTNAERSKNGLAPLKVDLELSKVAREKSKDMAANNYFDHNSPTHGSPFDMMKKFGISYRSAGENIAMGQRTPEEVVQAWMKSQGHRENILSSSYTHIGVGYVENGNYWTQQFIGK